MTISESRQPRAIVMINDIRVAWLDIEVNNNSYYQADSFRVSVPVKGQPSGIDRVWWAGQDMMEVEIYAGIPSDPNKYTVNDLDLLIAARVDNCPHNMVTDVITLTGRDYTADLIDTKTSNKWPEKTSSAIATELATKYGLTSKYVTGTRGKTGSYYTHDHAKLQVDISEWDLLVWLASVEKFQVYIEGKDLHFKPAPSTPPVYSITWEDATTSNTTRFNGTSLVFDRNLTLAKDVIVHVKSWNQKQKKGFIKTAKAPRTKDKTVRGYRIGKPQIYSYSIPNLTPEQALQRAQAKLVEITKHQLSATISGVPAVGIDVLTPRHSIVITGTGPYDQSYTPDSITRKISIPDGYVMDIIAKNHDVNSAVTF